MVKFKKKSWRIKVKFTDIQWQRLKRVRKLWKVKAQFCCLRPYFQTVSEWGVRKPEFCAPISALYDCWPILWPFDADHLTFYAFAVTWFHCLLLYCLLFIVLPSGTSLTSWSWFPPSHITRRVSYGHHRMLVSLASFCTKHIAWVSRLHQAAIPGPAPPWGSKSACS